MATGKDENRKKGTFGDVRLSVTKKYIFPLSRKLMMRIGGIGCAVVAMYYAADSLLLKNTFIASGPVSANHANFEHECAKCHAPFKGVNDARCSTCHEKTNDKLGVYSFAAHYLYRSEMPSRIQDAKRKNATDEKMCAACHPDHNGRDGKLTVVTDAKCASCHYSSFNNDHPQFEFARMNVRDDSTLMMTHVKHTKEVLKKLNTPNIETACLYCHTPMADGKGFKPLDFDTHCGDCHLTARTETASLTIRDPNSAEPGVETLETIQRRKGPGTLWAFYTNANEFTVAGTRVKKSPVYHRDPWIMENLKTLRSTLYTEVGISDLLKAAGAGAKKSKQLSYNEAIQTLRDYVAGLRSRPEQEIQMELMKMDSLLDAASRAVNAPGATLSDSLLRIGLQMENPALSAQQKLDVEDFAQKLAKPCLECHLVERAAILGVQASQRTLMRAEFDHRAHITQRRCLECHNAIPVEKALSDDTTGVAALIKAFDVAATQNIPKKENCIECHTSSAGSNACITCHFMHPNKTQRGSLQLFVEKK